MSRALPAALLVLVLVAAGCGGSASSATVSSSQSTATTTASTATGPPPAASIDPNFDFGQNVLITAQGFRPAWLVSIVGKPIVWWNESGKPQRIVFDHEATHSPVIPAGGSYRYTTSAAVSVTYHSASGLHGKVQVTPSAQ